MKNQMKRIFAAASAVLAALLMPDTGACRNTCPVVDVKNVCIPVLVGECSGPLAVLCIDNASGEDLTLDGVTVAVSGLPEAAVKDVSLLYTGTMSPLHSETESQAIKSVFARCGGSQRIFSEPDYAMLQDRRKPGRDGTVFLGSGKRLVKGRNWFHVSLNLDGAGIPDLSAVCRLEVTEARIDGSVAPLEQEGPVDRRLAVGLRNHGDDGVFAYRIPGIATTPQGTLIAVYDVRHYTTFDLQEDIDVGMSRSTDGGRSWEKMKIIMDMGEWGGLPQAQNGIGDPAVLVDEATGEIFVVAVWTHGLGNGRAWNKVGDGFSPEETAQLMIVSSKDDGRTWSEPRNITSQVKHRDWRFTLQGPGRGISMKDGTLVFPVQYVGPDMVPSAGIMYSRDHGRTWLCHGPARANTTESQVAEVSPGVLMLNMRNNLRTGRVVCTTSDFGRTWTEHSSTGKLREPVCMAGLLHVPAEDNVLGKDILLFSNPDTEKGRSHITVKASLDGGETWLPENSLLLDEEEGWGYSCLTMIDRKTVGILYEGSVSQIVFQAVDIGDIAGGGDGL